MKIVFEDGKGDKIRNSWIVQDLGRDFQVQSMKFLFWLVMALGKAEVKNQRV